MLRASCPSCGSPVDFRHAAALTVVCAACSSCVVRAGVDVEDHGKVAPIARDLSPLQIGARGTAGKRGFEVVGVLRRGRAGVRWNEWAIVFEDGGAGWIGEGNGQFQLFHRADPLPGGRAVLAPGSEVRGPDDSRWIVAEADTASVLAAEGALPYAVSPGVPTAYADLRRPDGAEVATLDLADEPPTFYAGRVVALPDLKLTGLRPIAGWSDPALVDFAGPEITGTRALTCPGCGGALTVRTPGITRTLACSWCGRSMDVDAEGDLAVATLIGEAEGKVFQPRIALGARGTLRGVTWQVIGAMIRSVWEDGVEYAWSELFLYNPFHGTAWLVCDGNDQWSLVELLACQPQPVGRAVRQGGVSYRRFQSGEAGVRAVLGEFTWEVRVGDRADTADYVAPPRMLSSEHYGTERTWSLGTWLPVAEVEAAFGVKLPRARGIAPHQPNPYDAPSWKLGVAVQSAVLVALAVAVLGLAAVLPARQTLHTEKLTVGPTAAWALSSGFTMPDVSRDAVRLTVRTDLPSEADLSVSLLSVTSGEVVDWTLPASRAAQERTTRLDAGEWQVRVEAHPLPASTRGNEVTLEVVRDPGGWFFPLVAAAMVPFALLAMILDRTGFEARRWSTAEE